MEELLVFFIGASGYGLLEIIWRGYTHWTMLVVGGICYLALYKMFAYLENTPALLKGIIGGLVITTAELVAGMILNVRLGMNVWDYSNLPFNLYGQICLIYSFLWAVLSVPLVYISKKIKKLIDRYA